MLDKIKDGELLVLPKTPLEFRFDHATKTSAVLLDVSPQSKQKFQELCKERLANYVPMVSSPSGSGKMRTPNGKTEMFKHTCYGITDVYTSVPPKAELPIENAIKLITKIVEIALAQNVMQGLVPAKDITKKVQSHKTSLIGYTKAKKSRKKMGGKREPSQQVVMVDPEANIDRISATTILKKVFTHANIIQAIAELKFSEEEKNIFINQLKTNAEWLHLIAHAIIGNKRAQKSDNIVLGTVEANSQMLVIETYQQHCLKNKEEFTVTTESDVVKNTHISTGIKVTLKFKDESKPDIVCCFNPFTANKPIAEAVQFFSIAQTVRHSRAKRKLDELLKDDKLDDNATVTKKSAYPNPFSLFPTSPLASPVKEAKTELLNTHVPEL